MVPSSITAALQGVSVDVAIIAGTALAIVVVIYGFKKMGDALAMPDIERSSHKEYHDAARWSETSRRKGGF